MSRLSIVAVCIALALSHPARASVEDQAQRSRLAVTVMDQTGAVIPNASVTLEGQPGGPPPPEAASILSNRVGVAVLEGIVEGRYTVHVAFEGFEPAVLRDVRVRGRETRVRATLQIKKLDQAVTVSRDRQTNALDPRGSAFSSVLTREQIDALPDDPDDMEAALKALAPPGSVIRVDGFTGGKLPPKSQIRSIRLPRLDMFAAQNHGGMMGMTFIDIMTMPGNGPLRGNVDFHFLDESFNARNPFTATKGAEQVRQYGYGLSGTITPNRTSFSINGGGGAQFSSPNLLAVLPDGRTVTDTLRQPRDSFNLFGRLDHAFTKDHAL
ncbi:MAG: carboxypeptidase regulatory-like domain-containing protein, partial [Acidobacteria bacterium]